MSAAIYDDRSSISSVPRKSFSEQVQTLGQRLQRALSNEGDVGTEDQTAQERSRSRGRRLKSSGRGGAGNIHSDTIDEGTYVTSVPVSGREVSESPARVYGRGGAGNWSTRSPSAPRGRTAAEDALIRESVANAPSQPHSAGRGGAGNMVNAGVRGPSVEPRSRSRAPATTPPVALRTTSASRSPTTRMSGRGGAGNYFTSTPGP